MLSLVEIPPGGCIYEYVEPIHDENLFVIGGNATIEVAGIRLDSWQDGLNVLVPKGVPHKIINRSSVDPLTVLCLRVRPIRNMGGTICS
jgi:mannose-6-phosphate isomerase-like protein (cupin superfamily)